MEGFNSYFRSHCACDDIFYSCLKNVVANKPKSRASKLAKNVGKMFFNFLKLNCIEPVYPKFCVESTIYYKISRFVDWKGKPSNTTSPAEETGCNKWEEDQDSDPINIRFLETKKIF